MRHTPPHYKGAAHPCWKGGIVLMKGKRQTYVLEKSPGHPRARKDGYVLQHILIAERVLGHFLPAQAQVHHVDEDGTNNTNRNLVICENNAYHKLLHRRMRPVKTHCDKGHALEGDNLYVPPGKYDRQCKQCKATNKKQWNLAHRR